MTKTVEEVFEDFKGRRAGIIKALTTDVNEFNQLCDPEKENLCLYGLPNGTWEVDLPFEEMPPELPEPALGINFARDGTQEPDWLALLAIHRDSWLISLAFYFGGRFGFEKNERHQLFEMINELPTVFEVVSEADKKSRDNYICAACGNNYATNKFWSCCGICEIWFNCINKCPHCSDKRPRV